MPTFYITCLEHKQGNIGCQKIYKEFLQYQKLE